MQNNELWSVPCESESDSAVSDSLWSHGLYSPWHSPGPNTGVRSRSLLQGIFPTQGSNPGLPYCRQILYHQGSPRILEWVACPFSSGSSQPRNQTEVSCIAGGFFTSWATREAWSLPETYSKINLKWTTNIYVRAKTTKGNIRKPFWCWIWQ